MEPAAPPQPRTIDHSAAFHSAMKVLSLPDIDRAVTSAHSRLPAHWLRLSNPAMDSPSLAGFVRRAVRGGYISPADLTPLRGDDQESQLHLIAHKAHERLGLAVAFDDGIVDQEAIAERLQMKGMMLSRESLVHMIHAGLQNGLCEKEEVFDAFHQCAVPEAQMGDWWFKKIFTKLESAVDALGASAVPVNFEVQDHDEGALVALGVDDLHFHNLRLPEGDDSASVIMRDLLLVFIEAIEEVGYWFIGPTDVYHEGHRSFLAGMDAGEIKEALGEEATIDAILAHIDQFDDVDEVYDLYPSLIHFTEGQWRYCESNEDARRDWASYIVNVNDPRHWSKGRQLPPTLLGNRYRATGERYALNQELVAFCRERLDAAVGMLTGYDHTLECLTSVLSWIEQRVHTHADTVFRPLLCEEGGEVFDNVPLTETILIVSGHQPGIEFHMAEAMSEDIMNIGRACDYALVCRDENYDETRLMIDRAKWYSEFLTLIEKLAGAREKDLIF